jgi:predicted metalloprotease with PDZ domain
MSLSDQNPRNGIEHHESSDDRLPERFFVDEKFRKQGLAALLSHEYAHSWNGKYRRPEGLATADYQKPMQTRLLWVYEGLTEYLGFVLAGRCGFFDPELAQEHFAVLAERAKLRAAQPWRPLADTAVAAPFLYGAPNDWESRQRGVDFYGDGALIWLDADTLIREKTDGKKSLDDFCKAFHGGSDSNAEVKPYTYDEVVTTLNGILPFDWKTFFDRRLNIAADAPLEGLTRSGWQLVYNDKPGELAKADEEKTVDLRGSVGMIIAKEGQIRDVVPGSAADKAAIGPSMKLLAVNERQFTPDRLKDAIKAAKAADGKMTLILEDGEYYHTVELHYDGGLRYPHLERIASSHDRLSEILKPTTATAE